MTNYDDTTGLPTERHQAPAGIPKANDNNGFEVPLGSGITINGRTYTSALVQLTGGASDFPIFNPPYEEEIRTYIVKAQFDGFGFVTRGDESHLVIKMKHFVFYDRELGPLNDLQRVNTPEEIAALKRKAKEAADENPDADVDTSGGLFDDAGNVTGDLDADTEDEPARAPEPDNVVRPAFSDQKKDGDD
ncbi:hypothetical protein PBI_BLUEBERRY_63 [Gordonia phage Blueberry]|uniref:Uncharacterized protein n=1 Tax=Gordonia phage Azula TaxID=2762397 RepID=A0A7G8LKV3_9CAUD|nr:hypothetical protein BH771_gp63 [Gordonia phage Blueberry]YP_010109990.1 hypothetical protein KNV23_gp64 [Gordonia phage Azula]QGJ97438.1 hypothetical protein SEA_GAMBINO_66 [Gordonia phage Gambino]QZD97496.1 hypothetical protein SEA_MISSRONA_64 [Gordonia phage MissRona]ANA85525.1 hypothetical protein PBI_BLUEBERRY_63 [Gordonia phage Blueberry]QNJ57875.1 hypothetical protein SEA_AZULA_64 [Gordonia phage Azula]